MEYDTTKISGLREVARSRGLKGWTALRKNDLREFLRPKRVLVAERLTKQNQDRKPEDLLTGDKEPIPTLPPTINTITLQATDEKSDFRVILISCQISYLVTSNHVIIPPLRLRLIFCCFYEPEQLPTLSARHLVFR